MGVVCPPRTVGVYPLVVRVGSARRRRLQASPTSLASSFVGFNLRLLGSRCCLASLACFAVLTAFARLFFARFARVWRSARVIGSHRSQARVFDPYSPCFALLCSLRSRLAQTSQARSRSCFSLRSWLAHYVRLWMAGLRPPSLLVGSVATVPTPEVCHGATPSETRARLAHGSQ